MVVEEEEEEKEEEEKTPQRFPSAFCSAKIKKDILFSLD